MIYLVEYCTDSRNRDVTIKKVRTYGGAIKWLKEGNRVAYPAAANKELPSDQQNWHRRVREAYWMPYGWLPPSRKLVKDLREKRDFYQSDNDCIWSAVLRAGKRIEVGEE